MNRPHLKSLTGARFFAAMAVLFVHFSAMVFHRSHWLSGLTVSWTAGVSFFFVLSGFVLTYNYFSDFSGGVSREGLSRFGKTRLARIYPMHVTALLLIAPLCIYLSRTTGYPDRRTSVEGFFAHLFLVQEWVPIPRICSWWNVPSWSIGAEAVFYAAFPWFCSVVLHRSRTWRKAAAVAIAVYAVGTVLFILMARFTADGWRHRSPGDALFLLAYQQPLFRIWEFFVGCALGMMFLDRPAFLHNRVVVNVLLVLGFIPSALIMYGSLHDYPSLARVNVSYPLFTPGFALVVLCLASGVSFLEGLLSHRWLILLGEASYSLYLLHWIPALAMSRFYPDGVGATTGVGIIAVCVVASIVTYRFVEYPARRAILRQTGERRKAQEVQLIPS